MSFGTWVIIFIVAVIVIAAIQIYITYEKKKEMEKSLRRQKDFSATQKIMGCDGNSCIAIDEIRKKIGLVSNNLNKVSIRVISCRDLLSSEIFEDGTTITKTSRSSQLGGALIGGIAQGGVGALIGGLSGKTTTSGKIKRVVLRLIVNDTTNPTHEIYFQNVEGNSGGLIHEAAMKQARHWHSLCDVLIKRADEEDKVLAPKTPQIISQPYVADELKKLAELQSVGVLTADEFQQQKAVLLKG